MANGFERLARITKVSALLAVLDSLDEPPTAADLEGWPPELWALLSEVANVNPPSATARAMVARELRSERKEVA